ncbi:MAG: Ig-like domain-containing protein [Myxococcota bacterium]
MRVSTGVFSLVLVGALTLVAGCGDDDGTTGGTGGAAGMGGGGAGGDGGSGGDGGIGGDGGAGGTGGSPDIPVTGVSVSPLTATIEVGATEQLVATVTPDDATDPAVSWMSSDVAIATVSSEGLVTGASPGEAIVTVTTEDGEFTDTSTVTVVPPSSFPATDFGDAPDGTPLADFGYEVDDNGGGSPAFDVSGGVIASSTDGLGGFFDFTTPLFAIDRDDDGGVIAEWDVRYPETVPGGDQERSKFYVRLTDASGSILYQFLYKPYLSLAEANWNLEIAEGPTETSLLQVRSRDVDPAFTPTGPSAPWINFKFQLLDNGDIKLLIDDVEYMTLTDETYTEFSRVTFTYRTTAEPKNYPIEVRNLSVLPLN